MRNAEIKNSIFVGDALEILRSLPSNSVDLGITSPPYNKQENKNGWLVKNVRYNATSDKMDEIDYQQNQIGVLDELFRLMKPGGSFFYNHKIRWERGKLIHPIHWLTQTKWSLRQEIIWDRTIAANIRGWRFWQVDERIYWLYKPRDTTTIGEELKSKHALLTSIWKFPPERQNSHPAPFPLVLPVRCIHSILDDQDGVVIDPYVGSGTTMVAAALLSKKYLGIDVSKEYVRLTKERLKLMETERAVVESELQKHVVKQTFKERKERGLFVGKFRNKDTVPPDSPNLFL